MERIKKLLLFSFLVLIGVGGYFVVETQKKSTQLYWFIPDGLRAEPDTFKIYEWAQQGKLPHIKKLMERGTYGYSVPVFPGHTPSNFATLFTGVLPKDHGIADGPLRSFGYPLKMVSRSGFSSTSKEVDPLWFTLEKEGMVSSLLSVPGSTPPEVSQAQVVKGRWGNWGLEFTSAIYHSAHDHLLKERLGKNEQNFSAGKKLTYFIEPQEPKNWKVELLKSFTEPVEVSFTQWNGEMYGLFIDTLDDGKADFTEVVVSKDKLTAISRIKSGEWTDWVPINLLYTPQGLSGEAGSLEVATHLKIGAIQITSANNFRFKILYGALNDTLTFPSSLANELIQEAGPMVDFPDDYPPQLIYFENDKKTFLDEFRFSFDWHEKMLDFFFREKKQDILIHNIYTPNQMLTSRWWMGAVDPHSVHFSETQSGDREQIWSEVLELYQRVDKMLGLAMKHLNSGSYIVLSSDHGVAALNTEVRLNNFFAKKKWLNFIKDKETGALSVDWKTTKVVFLQSNHIYLNTKNLEGPYNPQSGAEYDQFLNEVKAAVENLMFEKEHPFVKVYARAEVESQLGLPPNLVGDLVITHQLGFCAVEDITVDQQLYLKPLKSGYKQGLNPQEQRSLWTPFIVSGPGLKAGYALKQPISHLDQYPLIMKLLGKKSSVELKNEELKSIFQ